MPETIYGESWKLWAMRPEAIQEHLAQIATVEDIGSLPRCSSPKVQYCGGPLKLSTLPKICGEWSAEVPVETRKLAVPKASGTVAVVPVRGVIGQHRSWMADVATDDLSAILGDLVASDSVGAIVLDFDSPGGTVSGVPEMADQVRGYREAKPIYSIANADMASAAYWIGSAASRSFVAPSGEAGSIGVWAAHVDASKMFDRVGFKVTLISAGKYKTEANPFEALSDEARAAIQEDVNTYYGQFVDAVAKSRNRRASTVRNGFGEGRMLTAAKAVEEGLVDEVATLPELLGAIVPARGRGRSALAALAIEEAEDA